MISDPLFPVFSDFCLTLPFDASYPPPSLCYLLVKSPLSTHPFGFPSKVSSFCFPFVARSKTLFPLDPLVFPPFQVITAVEVPLVLLSY